MTTCHTAIMRCHTVTNRATLLGRLSLDFAHYLFSSFNEVFWASYTSKNVYPQHLLNSSLNENHKNTPNNEKRINFLYGAPVFVAKKPFYACFCSNYSKVWRCYLPAGGAVYLPPGQATIYRTVGRYATTFIVVHCWANTTVWSSLPYFVQYATGEYAQNIFAAIFLCTMLQFLEGRSICRRIKFFLREDAPINGGRGKICYIFWRRQSVCIYNEIWKVLYTIWWTVSLYLQRGRESTMPHSTVVNPHTDRLARTGGKYLNIHQKVYTNMLAIPKYCS